MQKFEYEDCGIEGLKVIYSRVSGDERGYFLKSYEKESLRQIGVDINVSEINESFSYKGVLRGLHFQNLKPQAKLVRVIEGEIFDVAVDLRKNSETYGKYHAEILSENNHKMFYLPKGFAHGFLTLSDTAKITYTCDGEYFPNGDMGIAYDDPFVDIKWPFDKVGQLILSEKDKKWKTMKESYIDFGV